VTCCLRRRCTGINHPVRVAVDTAGNVYVVDGGNHRVLKLAAEHS
jgi:DNA-binding beta-propeller fold protein YncE